MKKVLVIVILSLTFLLTSCERNTIDDLILVVGASSSPHAEILEQAREYIESQGYTLKIRVFSDYAKQNPVTQSGEVDANFFQHLPYLTDFNNKNKADLVSVLKVHFEPLGLYQGKRTSLNDLENAKIGIANDTSNGARGLLLLEAAGIIKLDKEKGLNVTKADIVENVHNVQIIELEAVVIPAQLVDLDFGVINGNYALEAKVLASSILAQEEKDSASADLYANIIVVKKGNEEKAAIKILIEALKQPHIAKYIEETYQGVVIPLVS